MVTFFCRYFVAVGMILGVGGLMTGCSTGRRLYYDGAAVMAGMTQYLDGYGGGAGRQGRVYAPPVDTVSWWKGDGVPGAPAVLISLGEQKAFFYKGGRLVGVSAISSGDEDHPTPTGRFTLLQKNIDHRSGQYGDYVDAKGNIVQENITRYEDPMPPGARYRGARMPYFMRFVRGVGMHAGYLPGYPASHGCVRMPEQMAKHFFENVSLGTPVEVRY